MSKDDNEKQLAKIMAWRLDPVLFVRECFGAEPEPWQAEALQAVVDNNWVAVRSGHGVGKTTFLSWVILWWMLTRRPVKVGCTANSKEQLRNVLWAEIRLWHNKLPAFLRNVLEIQTDRVIFAEDSTKAVDKVENFAVASTARKENPDALQGLHCLSEDHEILTRRGWLGLDEITLDDCVLSAPVNGDTVSWQPVNQIHVYPFVGKMNVYEAQGVSFSVTDEHRFPTKYLERIKNWKMKSLSEMAGQFMIRRSLGWGGDEFEVPQVFKKYKLSQEEVAEFIGFWIGDGGVRRHSSGVFYETLLYQAKDSPFLRRVLKKFRHTQAQDYFAISDRNLAEWLIDNVGRYGADRVIPVFLMNGPESVLDALCEGLWQAEGSFEGGKRRQFYNTNKFLVDQVQEILLKLGRAAKLGINRGAGVAKTVRGVAIQKSRICYVISWTNKRDHIVKTKNIRREPYSGRVWCVSTPLETFFTRRNGCAFLSGNSKHMLFVYDEAPGIDESVFEATRGVMSSHGAKTIMTGNPTRASGYFFNAFHLHRDLWWTRRVSCEEVPNRVADTFRKELIDEYGEDSNMFRYRYLGEFPISDKDVIIPLELLESAQEREVDIVHTNIRWGVDVARFGDDRTALVRRSYNAILRPAEVWNNKDTMQVAGLIAQAYRDEALELRPEVILVDVIGYGAGVVDRLAEIGLPVCGVNVAENASVKADFMRQRDELWFEARDWFAQRHCWMPKDERMVAELSGVTYNITSTGKRVVESKAEMKKNPMVKRSPDIADAVCLTFAKGYIPENEAEEYDDWGEDEGRNGTTGY